MQPIFRKRADKLTKLTKSIAATKAVNAADGGSADSSGCVPEEQTVPTALGSETTIEDAAHEAPALLLTIYRAASLKAPDGESQPTTFCRA